MSEIFKKIFMNWSDILSFKVLFFSKDGESAPTLNYLLWLTKNNQPLAIKALYAITSLPKKIFENKDVKRVKIDKKIKLFEIRIKSHQDICRFFFVIKKPHIIVLHGFTKKSQKITKKDKLIGKKFYLEFLKKEIAIPLTLDKI